MGALELSCMTLWSLSSFGGHWKVPLCSLVPWVWHTCFSQGLLWGMGEKLLQPFPDWCSRESQRLVPMGFWSYECETFKYALGAKHPASGISAGYCQHCVSAITGSLGTPLWQSHSTSGALSTSRSWKRGGCMLSYSTLWLKTGYSTWNAQCGSSTRSRESETLC